MYDSSVKDLIVVTKTLPTTDRSAEKVALYGPDGLPLNLDPLQQTGASVVLTGYVAGAADDVLSTDTVNAALAKLEARIAALELAAS